MRVQRDDKSKGACNGIISAAGETTDLRHRHFAAPFRRYSPWTPPVARLAKLQIEIFRAGTRWRLQAKALCTYCKPFAPSGFEKSAASGVCDLVDPLEVASNAKGRPAGDYQEHRRDFSELDPKEGLSHRTLTRVRIAMGALIPKPK